MTQHENADNVIKLKKNNAEQILSEALKYTSEKTKLLLVTDDGDDNFVISATGFTPAEMLWNLESLKLSLLAGEISQ